MSATRGADTGNVARRHHYVPQFYLRTWNDSDGKGLWVYSRDAKGGIKSRRCSARSIGFAEDLYTLLPDAAYPPPPNHAPDALEKSFFAKIDEHAARVHKKLVSTGIRELSSEDRSVWALFMNSLMERAPDRIEQVEREVSEEELAQEFRSKFGNRDLPDKINLTALRKNTIRQVLAGYIVDEAFIAHLINVRWATVDVDIEGEHFVTSDRPILQNAASGGYPIHCLSMAISPTRLLIVHGESNDFDEKFIRTLAVSHNSLVIRQAKQYLVSSAMLVDGPHMKYSKAVLELAKSGS